MTKMTCLRQTDAKDCGVACLLMVIYYYHGKVPIEYLKEQFPNLSKGTNFYCILEVAKKIGLDGYGINGSLKDFDKQNLPCIAQLLIKNTCEHFVIISDLNFQKEIVTIEDPSRGHYQISFKNFLKESTEMYLILKPYRPLLIIENQTKTTFFFYLKNYKSIFIRDFLLTLLIVFTKVYSAFYISLLLTYVINPKQEANILRLIIFSGGLGLISSFASLLEKLNQLYLQKHLSLFLYKNMLKQVLYLPYIYYKNHSTGDILARFQDIQIVLQEKILFYLGFFKNSIIFLFFECLLFYINSFLSFVILGYYFIILIITILYHRKQQPLLSQYEEQNAIFNNFLLESINGVNTIKGTHEETSFLKSNLQKVKILLDIGSTYVKNNTFEEIFKSQSKFILTLLINAIGAYLIIKNKFTLGNLMTFNYLLENMNISIIFLLHILENRRTFNVSSKRLKELFEIEKESFAIDMTYQNEMLQGDIKLINLSYQLIDHKILNDITFNIKKGAKVMITGPSGCGKSTLLKIIYRYYKIARNQLFIDDKDLMDYHLEDIRKHIAYCSQQEYLFTNTIYQNIVLERKITYNQFLDICKLTLVDDIIVNSPLGYQTLMEENGFTISGGEKERIILARTLVKDADLYLLDEAFSEIDSDRERLILKNIFAKYPSKTFLIVSHRLDNIDLFDDQLILS